MAFFRLEMFDTKGKTTEVRHIDMPGISTVAKALKHEKAVLMKKRAMLEGVAFRCKREDD